MSEVSQDEIQQILASMDPEARAHFAEAALGKDAEELVGSDIGQYLVGVAQQEVREAYEELKKVSPWRVLKVQELQNRIWKAETFVTELRALILNGRTAARKLEEVED